MSVKTRSKCSVQSMAGTLRVELVDGTGGWVKLIRTADVVSYRWQELEDSEGWVSIMLRDGVADMRDIPVTAMLEIVDHLNMLTWMGPFPFPPLLSKR